MMINGVFCHETGCPNTHKVYDSESEEWVSVDTGMSDEWDEWWPDEGEEL